MQALMLAAGTGSRLGKYTNDQTKCMVTVGDKTLLEHTAIALKNVGINRFIIVIGHEGARLEAYAKEKITDMELVFVDNKDYATSNNIYSLYLAGEELKKDDTILVESDLIYDESLLQNMIDAKEDNVVAVAPYEAWMDGTLVTLDAEKNVAQLIEKQNFHFVDEDQYFKTVNIYKFSKEFSRDIYLPFMEEFMKDYGLNQYYEMVLKVVAEKKAAVLSAYVLGDEKWYEIDDVQDLKIANTLFMPVEKKYDAYARFDGGYWRFDNLVDFTSPYTASFPTKRMIEQMQFMERKTIGYRSADIRVCRLLASKILHIDEEYLVVLPDRSLLRMLEGEYHIIDETEKDYTQDKSHLSEEFLSNHTDTYIIKELAKTYGMPGLGLVVVATKNEQIHNYFNNLLSDITLSVQTEYMLQIFDLYAKGYAQGIEETTCLIDNVKESLKNKSFDGFEMNGRVVTCFYESNEKAKEKATELLEENMFVMCEENQIRFYVRDEKNNTILISKL